MLVPSGHPRQLRLSEEIPAKLVIGNLQSNLLMTPFYVHYKRTMITSELPTNRELCDEMCV
jgi:hypothetical protein